MDRDRRTLLLSLGGGMIMATRARAIVPAAIPRPPRAPAKVGIVDVHAHVAVPAYLALLAEAGVRPAGYSQQAQRPSPTSGGASADSDAAIAARLTMMDAADVSTQILSPSLAPYVADEATAVRAARLANDRHAALAKAYPARLAGLVCLPLPHVDAALAELRRGLDILGLVGVSIHTTCLGTSIADPRFAPLFAEMNRRKAMLLIHPSVNGLESALVRDWRLETSAGPLLEDNVVALQLIAASVPVRFPDMRIVVPHLGGGLAVMLERLDNQMPLAIPGLAARPSEMARHMWYDTVSHGSAAGLRAAVEAFGADRLVPGSDFPVLLSFAPYERTFAYIRDAVPAAAAEHILYRNAAVLLPSINAGGVIVR